MKVLQLKAGKERSLLRHHPWIFESAIQRGGGDSGETIKVISHDEKFLGWAAYSPKSKIRARIWSFNETERIDAAFFARRIEVAIAARNLMAIESSGSRLIHAEADGLPGLIVDRYNDTLVVQLTSAGVERWRDAIIAALSAITGLTNIYERSDSSSRTLEGLEPRTGWITTAIKGNAIAPTDLIISEHGWKLKLSIAEGHKTGFYLDQRDSRKRFAEITKRLGFKDVLNCFCYTGGFTVAALAGGAQHVTSVDSSSTALELAKENVALNGFDPLKTTFVDADVNQVLRQAIKDGKRFDAIILDPPKFAPTITHAERAARAYKDINRLALMLLAPNGVLFTFSCSGGIAPDLFHKIVASAGTDAAIDGYITERLGGAPDHPMTINFPEGEYLKGLVVVRK